MIFFLSHMILLTLYMHLPLRCPHTLLLVLCAHHLGLPLLVLSPKHCGYQQCCENNLRPHQ